MVFFMSVLVFLAGIMTYLFFPRNDAYQQQMFSEEASIVSFVNQHQAAKDTVFQLVSYGDGMTVLDADNLFSHLPRVMQGGDGASATHDIALDSDDKAVANPDPETNPHIEVESFSSAVACGEWVENLAEADCTRWTNIGGTLNCTRHPQALTIGDCNGQSPKFVMTYGPLPGWWSEDTDRRRAWFRALLKRTHGSKDCGVLEEEVVGGTTFYRLNTSQKHVGYEEHSNLSVIPTAITTKLQDEFGLSDLDGMLFCLTQVKPPYEGTPLFFWDSLNNNGTATGSDPTGIGHALTGRINDGQPDFDRPTYTLAGVASFKTSGDLLSGIGMADDILTATVGDRSLTIGGLTMSDLPTRGVSFVYSIVDNRETLTVFYRGTDGKWTHRTTARTIAGTIPTKIGRINADRLRSLRIYGTVSDQFIRRNAKTDQKRFGL